MSRGVLFLANQASPCTGSHASLTGAEYFTVFSPTRGGPPDPGKDSGLGQYALRLCTGKDLSLGRYAWSLNTGKNSSLGLNACEFEVTGTPCKSHWNISLT